MNAPGPENMAISSHRYQTAIKVPFYKKEPFRLFGHIARTTSLSNDQAHLPL